MTRDTLNAVIAIMTLAGALLGVGLVAWLVHVGGDAGAIAALATLAGSLLNMAAGVVRNRFPGGEPPERKP